MLTIQEHFSPYLIDFCITMFSQCTTGTSHFLTEQIFSAIPTMSAVSMLCCSLKTYASLLSDYLEAVMFLNASKDFLND